MKSPKESDAVSKVKHGHNDSVTSLKYACVNKSIIYIIMHKEKTPIYKVSHSKALKTMQICSYRHARKTSRPFSLYDMSVDLSSRKKFANLGSFAKVSVSVITIIP